MSLENMMAQYLRTNQKSAPAPLKNGLVLHYLGNALIMYRYCDQTPAGASQGEAETVKTALLNALQANGSYWQVQAEAKSGAVSGRPVSGYRLTWRILSEQSTVLDPSAHAQLHTLYTFGYGGRLGSELERHQKERDATVVDIRHTPFSSVRGYNRPELEASLGAENYTHIFELGNTNHKSLDGQIKIHNIEKGLARLHQILIGRNAILLCGCSDYHICHRSLVAEEAKQKLQVEVIHL